MKYPTYLQNILENYSSLKEKELKGRYVHLKHIEPLLKKHSKNFLVKEIGNSVLGKPVHRISLGSGKTKVLAWSQMHGNETTTTKAVFDFLNTAAALKGDNTIKEILAKCSIHIIPMLNPDGAEAYTRVNANKVDLNRDAQELKEPESRILKNEFEKFKPHFCLNLHDQRTIFSAGEAPEPATLSFLTPAMDVDRTIFEERQRSMQLICSIFDDLNGVLPGRIGRYDDVFNINCTGDTFQSQKVPTLLFEAGHAPGDYDREQVRKLVFAALTSVLRAIITRSFEKKDFRKYNSIPENQKLFNDVILRNVVVEGEIVDVAIQFKEELSGNRIIFVPVINKISRKISRFGHREIECTGKKVSFPGAERLGENVIVNKVRLNNEIIALSC